MYMMEVQAVAQAVVRCYESLTSQRLLCLTGHALSSAALLRALLGPGQASPLVTTAVGYSQLLWKVQQVQLRDFAVAKIRLVHSDGEGWQVSIS